jgi:hypothetical protein
MKSSLELQNFENGPIIMVWEFATRAKEPDWLTYHQESLKAAFLIFGVSSLAACWSVVEKVPTQEAEVQDLSGGSEWVVSKTKEHMWLISSDFVLPLRVDVIELSECSSALYKGR